MLFVTVLSILLSTGDAHLTESRYYNRDAGDTSWLDKGRSIGDGSYMTYGQVKYENDVNSGYNDGYSGRNYGRDRYGGRGSETCPYENMETMSRGKREAVKDERKTQNNEAFSKSILVNKLRPKRHDDYYPDGRYQGRDYRDDYNRDYRDDYNRRDYGRDYYGRDSRRDYNNDYYGRDGGDYGVVVRDRCGRESCSWEAELVCDGRGGGSGRSYDRGYGSGYDGGYGRDRGYNDGGYYDDRYRDGGDYGITWVRVNDAHYPRGKYNDLQEYFSGRLVGDARGDRLVIRNVKAEDKGTYRCYTTDGEFREVTFYPKYPLDSNQGC